MSQQFNPAATNANLVLSNNNLTVTQTGGNGNYQPAVCSQFVSSGKYYWELTCSVMTTDADMLAGFADASYDPLTSGNYLGIDANSYGWFHTIPYDATGGTITNNASASGDIAGFHQGDVVGIALDLDNLKWWGNINGGAWNSGSVGTQNPATNTGGIAVPSGMATAGVAPAVVTQNVGDVWIATFNSGGLANTPPSGFSPFIQDAITHSGTGTASGSSVAGAVGSSRSQTAGSASGTSAATATGMSASFGSPSIAGTSTAIASGSSTSETQGSATGASTATAIGANGSAQGTASGSSRTLAYTVDFIATTRDAIAANAIGSQSVSLQMASSAIGTASGTSTAIALAGSLTTGDASGTSAADAVGSSLAETVGTAEGTSFAHAFPNGFVGTTGTAAGTSSADAVGESDISAIGTADGSSSAIAAGMIQANAVGTAIGSGSAFAVAQSGFNAETEGTAAGTSDALGVVNTLVFTAGTAAGTSTCEAQAGNCIGFASGTSTCHGFSQFIANRTPMIIWIYP